jgi:hypothetical protein
MQPFDPFGTPALASQLFESQLQRERDRDDRLRKEVLADIRRNRSFPQLSMVFEPPGPFACYADPVQAGNLTLESVEEVRGRKSIEPSTNRPTQHLR